MKKILSLISILLLVSMSACVMDSSSDPEPTPVKRGVDKDVEEDDSDIIYLCIDKGRGRILEISGTKENIEKAGIETRERDGRCDSEHHDTCKKHMDTEKGITWQYMTHDTYCGSGEENDGTIDYSTWIW